MSYPSTRSWVRMRSESTRALGQPRLTKPTLGRDTELETDMGGDIDGMAQYIGPRLKDPPASGTAVCSPRHRRSEGAPDESERSRGPPVRARSAARGRLPP